MPGFDLQQKAQFSERRGTNAHILLWIIARNRDTGADESIGLWTGDDHQIIDVGGELRTYFGAGAVIRVAPIRAGVGLAIRRQRVVLPPMLDEVRIALRTYQARQARVELHSFPMDIDSGNPLSAPVRFFKGTLEEAPEALGPQGSNSKVELVLASAARALAIGLPLFRSNAALQLRNATDRGREYSDVAGEWVVPWGEG